MNRRLPLRTALTGCLMAWAVAAPVNAETVKVLTATGEETPQRQADDYIQARAISLRVPRLAASVGDLNAAVRRSSGTGQVMGRPGWGHQAANGLARDMTASAAVSSSLEAVVPMATGSAGQPFTSSRVAPKALDTTYPVRTVGKLYFTDGVNTYTCTGSMIKPGVVVTAGHCVHSGNGLSSGWYKGFEFIPAYRRMGSKVSLPYGAWTNWVAVTTTPDWYVSQGRVPNVGDFALIVFGPNSAGHRIGDYTGWLGWGTDLTLGRHITALGYPGNLDAAGHLHRIDAMATDGGTGNGAWGSDMQGGSSGGPVVLNWRVPYFHSSSAPAEDDGNVITSVTSWGYRAPAPKVQGGAVFNALFADVMTHTCSAYAWACVMSVESR